jgi:hypothetical protein
MRESLAAFLYVLIVATVTLLYVNYENIEFFKHPLNSWAATHDQADDE